MDVGAEPAAAERAAGGKQGDEADGKPAGPAKRSLVPVALVGLVVLGLVAYVVYEIVRPHPDAWTDDAYIRVHYTMVAPRTSGKIATVVVEDNQPVHAGQLLATLDPRDFETAVASAAAALARDRARVGDAGAMVDRQPALIEEAKAAMATAQANFAFAQANAKRYSNLAATGAGTTQERQQAMTNQQGTGALLQSAEAALDAARRQLDVLKAQKRAAEGTVELDEAQLEQAKLNLSYTRIAAPFDGTIGERSVQVGNYVMPGTTLMTLVPLEKVYVEANYRETDLRHVRTGQPVSIHIDAYDIWLGGVVESLPPASGASFAPLAPNNATGNFTKIVQRLPVKINFNPGQALSNLLRVGFSVETTIHTGLENVVGEDRRGSSPATATN